MPTTRTALPLALAALAVSMLSLSAAYAGEASYVGTWASDLAQCKIDQSRQEAPLALSQNGYDQYETHCKFKSADASDDQWKVTSDCTVEGQAQPYDFTLTVSGDTLTLSDETGARDLLRCK